MNHLRSQHGLVDEVKQSKQPSEQQVLQQTEVLPHLRPAVNAGGLRLHLVEHIIMDLVPLSSVSGMGMKRMLRHLNPKLPLPSRFSTR